MDAPVGRATAAEKWTLRPLVEALPAVGRQSCPVKPKFNKTELPLRVKPSSSSSSAAAAAAESLAVPWSRGHTPHGSGGWSRSERRAHHGARGIGGETMGGDGAIREVVAAGRSVAPNVAGFLAAGKMSEDAGLGLLREGIGVERSEEDALEVRQASSGKNLKTLQKGYRAA
ncbi:unnamed protein product [Lampetra planeri]